MDERVVTLRLERVIFPSINDSPPYPPVGIGTIQFGVNIDRLPELKTVIETAIKDVASG